MRLGGGSTVEPPSRRAASTNIKYPLSNKSINNSILVKKVLFFLPCFLQVSDLSNGFIETWKAAERQNVDNVEKLKTTLKSVKVFCFT